MIESFQKVAAGPRSLALTAAQDLGIGLMKSDLWGRLGWLEVKRRYHRTLLGPFWTSISLAMYVVAVGLVGSGLWHQEIREYLPFLISGMVAWLLVSTIISESCTLFVSGHGLLRPSLIGPTMLLAAPGLMLIVANGLWISLLCGMFCLRYRDVTQLVTSIIQISMLITPIF